MATFLPQPTPLFVSAGGKEYEVIGWKEDKWERGEASFAPVVRELTAATLVARTLVLRGVKYKKA